MQSIEFELMRQVKRSCWRPSIQRIEKFESFSLACYRLIEVFSSRFHMASFTGMTLQTHVNEVFTLITDWRRPSNHHSLSHESYI